MMINELIKFIKYGNLEKVTELISNSADVNAKNKYGRIALMCAASYGHLEIVKILIEKLEDINLKSDSVRTALILADENNHLDIVNYLEAFEIKENQ